MRTFRCLMPQVITFGPGKARDLAASIEGKNVLFLSDRGVQGVGVADALLAVCREKAASLAEFWDVPAEPTEQQVAEVVAAVDRPGLDVILAVGGGSVMDMAKFVSVMVQGGPSMEDLFAGRLPAAKTAKLVMVPTTAGTGSEATPNSIVLRPALNLKVGVVCDHFMADEVVLDPELLCGLPPHITAATGMDALCHAIECFVSKKANPVSDMYALESMRLTFKSLKAAYANGKDIDARGDTLLAAFYGGVCIASSGTNAVHALSYPLGGRYRIPHGVSNAILLAPVFATNVDGCADKLALVADLAAASENVSLSGKSEREKAVYLVEFLKKLSRDLNIPASLEELGIPADDLELLVDAAFEVKRLLDNNPRPLTKEDIKAIYTGILRSV
ncbi:MAG: Long-chain-alcohol dehydrogenase 1 [Desulfovibrio sp.]